MTDKNIVERAELERLQKDCGIPHLPTQLTYHLRRAPSLVKDAPFGSWAYQWDDKPHRLLYAACSEIELLTTHRDEAVAALRKYGRHINRCLGDTGMEDCQCGFTAALAKLEGK